MLQVKQLKVDFPSESSVVHAVIDVDISLERGRRIGFVGESGSGKTTTALAIMRLIKEPGIASGEVLLGDTDLMKCNLEQMRQKRLRRVSYIPQGAMNSLNPVMRIENQIWDGILDHEGRCSKLELKRRSKSALEGVGLSAEVGRMYPHELSGGMKQRACIAISTILSPELIIADEPTSALDVITQRQVMETLRKAQKTLGSALIIIGHDMGLMAQSVDELMVMKDGKIVERGAIETLFNNPQHPYTQALISSVPTIGGKSYLEAGQSADKAETKPNRSQSNNALLEFKGVSKTYGGGFLSGSGNTALQPLSFSLDDDEAKIISVVGQSGSGKSTMGGLMLGFNEPSTGQVLFQGKDLAQMNGQQKKSFRHDVQAVFQDPYGAFNPFYRVDRALSLPLKRFGIATNSVDIQHRMQKACRAVGLNPELILGRFAHELSGGQRQRLMVARALMLSPKLLIADEPVSMVDASLRAAILQNLYALKDQLGISIIYITHDLATAYHFSDYVIVLHQGCVAEAGMPEEVIGDPQHPYTKLLINSIPWPDVQRKWGSSASSSDDMRALAQMAKSQQSIIRSSIPGFKINNT